MLVSLDWLREFVRTDMQVGDIARTLTMLGLEVESIEAAGADHVLDVNITPNRPDCLSMLGIARELGAKTALRPTPPDCSVTAESGASAFRIEVLDPALCPRYVGRVVRGVTIGPSPVWMRERLEKSGIRSINNIVDITNYVLLEFGHPLHAFDLATLRGGMIRVGVAGAGTRITTLDGVDRALPEDALLILDAERPVAVAGVMGGAETEVSARTRDIFIESAYFLPASVRKTSKALGLKTEASYRFERGADVEGVLTALNRATRLVCELAGGKAEPLADAYPVRFVPRPISVSYAKVNRLLGTRLSASEMVGLLLGLGLDVREESERVVVVPPSFRHDLERDADVIEEVARLHGYGNIPTSFPIAEVTPAERNDRRLFVGEIKDMMVRSGYSEAVSLSFMNARMLDVLGLDADDPRRRAVAIRNPLRQEEALLRTTLVPALIEVTAHNFSRGVRDLRLFEVAKVFTATSEILPDEGLRLGCVCAAPPNRTLWPDPVELFYRVKGLIEDVFEGLRRGDFSFVRSREPFLHPGKSADIVVGGHKVGFMGVLAPHIVEAAEIKVKAEIVIAEIDLLSLLSYDACPMRYRQLPRFPSVERDVALVLDSSVAAAEVLALIRAYTSDLIESAEVFDVYKGSAGGPIPDGRKSLAFSVRYRSQDRTLTDQDVETVHAALVSHLTLTLHADIRS